MAEPENIVGPGPALPSAKPATPNAFRKSMESRLPRNINFLWPVLGIVVVAAGWAAFGDDLMSLGDRPVDPDAGKPNTYAPPPAGGFKLTFAPEPKPEPEPASPPPPPQTPQVATRMVEEEPRPKVEIEPQPDYHPEPETDFGPATGERKNPFGPTFRKVALAGKGLEDKSVIDATTSDRWQGCTIEPGYAVPVNLVHAVNSEIPGPAVFETREPYYSPANPTEPLLHPGARFIGHYRTEKGSGGDKLGDTRLSFKITAATIPDGNRIRRLKLDEARIAVLSGNGMVGLGGEVDQNLFPLLAYATVAALIDSATRTATDEEDLGGRMRGAAVDNYGDVGREVADRTLDVAPKMEILPGPALLLFSDPVRVGKCP